MTCSGGVARVGRVGRRRAVCRAVRHAPRTRLSSVELVAGVAVAILSYFGQDYYAMVLMTALLLVLMVLLKPLRLLKLRSRGTASSLRVVGMSLETCEAPSSP